MIQNFEKFATRDAEVTIENKDWKQVTQISYNLTVGAIVDADGDVKDEVLLPPQGIVNIFSEEVLVMPDDYVAYATVKNGMSRKGLLAINIGVIDPGYKGMVASHLINFGRNAQRIKKGQPFLRLTFHKFEKPAENRSLSQTSALKYESKEVYVEERVNETRNFLGSKFLDLDITAKNIADGVEKKVLSSMLHWATVIGLPLAGLALVIAACTYAYDVFKSHPVSASPSGSKETISNDEVRELKRRIEALDRQLASFLDPVRDA